MINSTLLLVKILKVFNELLLSCHCNLLSDCIITRIFWPTACGSASKAPNSFFWLFYRQPMKTNRRLVSSMFRFWTIIWGRSNTPLFQKGCLRFYGEFRLTIFIGWRFVSTSKMHRPKMNILIPVFWVVCRFLPFWDRFCWFLFDLWILHLWRCPFLLDRGSRLTHISQKLFFYCPSKLKRGPCLHSF